jgi:hypothetical protein
MPMMSDADNMGNAAQRVTLHRHRPSESNREPPILLFLLFLPEIISERPRLCGRNPGLSPI